VTSDLEKQKKSPPKESFASEALVLNYYKIKRGPVAGTGGR